MQWLREAVSDSGTGKASAKRVALLMATVAMSATMVCLGAAAIAGHDVAAALGAIAIPLAGLGGYSYVHGKRAEAERNAPPAGPSA